MGCALRSGKHSSRASVSDCKAHGGLSAHRVLALSDEGELEWSEPGTEERAAPGWKAAMDRRHPGDNDY